MRDLLCRWRSSGDSIEQGKKADPGRKEMCGLSSLCTGLSGAGDFFGQKTHFTSMSKYLQDAASQRMKFLIKRIIAITVMGIITFFREEESFSGLEKYMVKLEKVK